MELQAQVTALEEEVGMLKGEIKAILQEVRVAVLARQNPFLSNDLELPIAAIASANPFAPAELPVSSPATVGPQVVPAAPEASPRVVRLTSVDQAEDEEETPKPAAGSVRRPIDLAALMVWVQECAGTFNHTEFVMLVTMASYADYFDAGLKQALLDMSEQVAREHTAKASLADFSLALKKLEAIRATTGRNRRVA